MVQGLGPGLTIVATRRSVIRSAEGLELIFTFFWAGRWAAASRDSSAPPAAVADVLKRSRRLRLRLRPDMSRFLPCGALARRKPNPYGPLWPDLAIDPHD